MTRFAIVAATSILALTTAAGAASWNSVSFDPANSSYDRQLDYAAHRLDDKQAVDRTVDVGSTSAIATNDAVRVTKPLYLGPMPRPGVDSLDSPRDF